jgi:2-methylcitrate dehydratase PrpD
VTDTTISTILAEQVAAIAEGDIGEREHRAFSRACIDFVTCAMLGSSQPVTEATLRYFSKTDLGRQATILGRIERLSPASAAFVNAASAHGLDFDDGHTQAGGHPGAAVFPTVFALAEHLGSSSEDIVRAVIAGYHGMVRVARMMHPRTARTGWHNTAVAGTFGAAAAAAVLLKLDVARTAHAFGLAGSFTGGLLEFLAEGPDSKRIHPGMAARDGIVCAGLAEEGLTGPSRVFEGAHGVFNAFINGEGDTSVLHSDDLEIEGIYFKLYPCCRHYHAAIDGLLDLREESGLKMEDVAAVRLGLYGVAVRGHDHRQADTMLGAQMSAPIAAGLALVDGAVSASGFAQDSLRRVAVREAIERVEVAVDAECESVYPGLRSGVVAIDLADGRTLERRVLGPRGESTNPLDDADLERKLRVNCAPLIGQERSETMLETIWNFANERTALDRLLQAMAPARHNTEETKEV